MLGTNGFNIFQSLGWKSKFINWIKRLNVVVSVSWSNVCYGKMNGALFPLQHKMIDIYPIFEYETKHFHTILMNLFVHKLYTWLRLLRVKNKHRSTLEIPLPFDYTMTMYTHYTLISISSKMNIGCLNEKCKMACKWQTKKWQNLISQYFDIISLWCPIYRSAVVCQRFSSFVKNCQLILSTKYTHLMISFL